MLIFQKESYSFFTIQVTFSPHENWAQIFKNQKSAFILLLVWLGLVKFRSTKVFSKT